MSKKLWGGRFAKPTSSLLEHFNASIFFDVELAQEDILGSLAHAAMLRQCDIISQSEYELIRRGLQDIAQEVALDRAEFCVEDEDVHMNIERMLTQKIGAVAGKLHTARSRNDQVALDLHLYLRKHTVIVAEKLIALQDILLTLALQHRATILPGYTHLQRAQPIYLASHFLAYFSMLQRDITRLKENWSRINVSPLGAAALAGSSLKIDKHYTANILGFDGIYHNSLDAVSDRDFAAEFLFSASLMMMHLSRFSEELILWSSQEFNFISFDDAFATGSSIMPQKKNPDVVELARGKTARVYGALFSILTLLKALPLAYNKDLQEDKEPVFDVVKTLGQTLTIFVPLLQTMTVNANRMRQAVDQGYLNATALAEYLVKKELSFRSAHLVAGKMVAHCITKKCRLDDLALNEMKTFSDLIDQDIYEAISVEAIVIAHDKGNAKNTSLLGMELEECAAQLAMNQIWAAEKSSFLTAINQQIFESDLKYIKSCSNLS